MTKSTKAVKPVKKPAKSRSADPDAFLLQRNDHYRLNRLLFELALAELDPENLTEQEEDAIEERQSSAVREMKSHIELLELEVRRNWLQTIMGLIRLLETAELIMASRQRSYYGALSKGDARTMVIAARGLVGDVGESGSLTW